MGTGKSRSIRARHLCTAFSRSGSLALFTVGAQSADSTSQSMLIHSGNLPSRCSSARTTAVFSFPHIRPEWVRPGWGARRLEKAGMVGTDEAMSVERAMTVVKPGCRAN
ncbi:hypothetical protein Bbelb_019360 [Branchiostoma belcheri]|nr:hypothetical protein Bbelb_019360 [Branchiostoma belcheri]